MNSPLQHAAPHLKLVACRSESSSTQSANMLGAQQWRSAMLVAGMCRLHLWRRAERDSREETSEREKEEMESGARGSGDTEPLTVEPQLPFSDCSYCSGGLIESQSCAYTFF